MESIKDIISKVVNSHQGVDAFELVIAVMRQSIYVTFPNEAYNNALMELIEDREIVEVEYTLPSADYRVKNMYFPKGTMVEVTKVA